MANTKNYSIREMVLDRCLSSGVAYSRPELQDACNRELERRGEKPVSSKVTILNDLNEIQNKFNIVIDQVRRGHTIYYRYHDCGFSIYNSELSDKEYSQLRESLAILKRFDGMPSFEWVDELEARFSTNFTSTPRKIVDFDENKYSQGMEYFSILFDAINNRHCINLRYKSFRLDHDLIVTVHPQLLKEYNNRWFLFCIDDKRKIQSIYALDRIKSIERSNRPYLAADSSLNDYFEDIVGVSSSPETKLETIRLQVSAKLYPYIATKPIHGSQKVVSSDVDKTIIEIEVKPNYELEQLILSYGEGMKVLAPNSFRNKIYGRLVKMLENYQE